MFLLFHLEHIFIFFLAFPKTTLNRWLKGAVYYTSTLYRIRFFFSSLTGVFARY